MNNTILETRQLQKKYSVGERDISVLQSVELEILAGEFVVLSGKSGSGKTTLLTLLSGLDRPSSGQVILDGQNLEEMTEEQLGPVRNRTTGFVFQSYYLVPALTALENVMFPAELNKDPEAEIKAEKLLRRVGLWERRDNLPAQLSGGEQQRVGICRALVNSPKIIFADEPTGNLDSENSKEVMDLLQELHRENNTTLVLATHSREVAAEADRVILIRDGKIFSETVGSGV